MSSAGIERIYHQPITTPTMLTMMLYCRVVRQRQRIGAGSKPAFYGNVNV